MKWFLTVVRCGVGVAISLALTYLVVAKLPGILAPLDPIFGHSILAYSAFATVCMTIVALAVARLLDRSHSSTLTRDLFVSAIGALLIVAGAWVLFLLTF